MIPDNGQRRHRRGRRALVVLGLALAALAAWASSALAATPGTVVLAGTDPAYTDVVLNTPEGDVPTTPGVFQLDVTVDGQTTRRVAFCIDATTMIGTGTTYPVSLQTASDDPVLASPGHLAAAWLINETPDLLAAATNKGLEAGAIQTAIWVLAGEVTPGTPTNDAVLNARANQLVALATGKALAGPVTIAANPATLTAGGTTTLNLTGTPGSTASLSVTSGQGTLSAAEVTFSPAGTASVTLTSAAAGAVTVGVSASGGQYWRATKTAANPVQDTAFVIPETYTAAATVTFTQAPTSVTPPPPPVEITQTPKPALTIGKKAPARQVAGSAVKYTITVRNSGKATARNVVVTDTIPSGMAYLRSSRAPASTGKKVTWKITSLAPGKSVTINVWLQAPSGLRGKKSNTATAVASGVKLVRATAATRFVPVPAKVQPAVTG
ncbi:MAG: hypothetical protein AB7V42_05880 [Thermoleophilia bacterium]